MNIVLQDESKRYFIISVHREPGMAPEGPGSDLFIVRSKRVDAHGRVLSWQNVASYSTLEDANARAKTLAIIKRKKGGMTNVPEKDVPAIVAKMKAAPVENQVSPSELIASVSKARKERYVILKDVTGMEEYFDAGVEYVGFTTRDSGMLDVFDKFGTLRSIMVSRTDRVSKTEQCIEAEGVSLNEVVGEAISNGQI